jgi:hypothetical protein
MTARTAGDEAGGGVGKRGTVGRHITLPAARIHCGYMELARIRGAFPLNVLAECR